MIFSENRQRKDAMGTGADILVARI